MDAYNAVRAHLSAGGRLRDVPLQTVELVYNTFGGQLWNHVIDLEQREFGPFPVQWRDLIGGYVVAGPPRGRNAEAHHPDRQGRSLRGETKMGKPARKSSLKLVKGMTTPILTQEEIDRMRATMCWLAEDDMASIREVVDQYLKEEPSEFRPLKITGDRMQRRLMET